MPLVHKFVLDTELARTQLLSFPRFVREKLSFGQIPGLRMSEMEALVGGEGHYLEFRAGPERGWYESSVRVYLDRPLRVEVRSSMGRDEAFERQLENALLVALQFFEEDARRSMIYVAFVPGRPRTSEVRQRSRIVKTLFSGNMLSLFLLLVIIGVPLVLILEDMAPPVLILIMLFLVLSAGRIFAMTNPWKITAKTPEVLIVQQKVPEGELARYKSEYREQVRAAKQKAYKVFSECPDLVCSDKVSEIFREAGLPAEPGSFLVRRVNLHQIFERVCSKFDMPVPTVVVTQEPKPNAAATGFSKKLATVLVTIGLLVQLEEEEIEVVVGHEMSHLRSADPMALFALVLTEYVLRVYAYGMYLGAFFFPYLVGVFWSIFFFGKFLETRADLEAGLVLGKPKVMAEALKKIAFRRLVLEEQFLEPEASRFGEWMRFDPHPPVYFRIQRLESLDLSNPPKHPFIASVRAVARGLARSGRTR